MQRGAESTPPFVKGGSRGILGKSPLAPLCQRGGIDQSCDGGTVPPLGKRGARGDLVPPLVKGDVGGF